VLAEVVRKIVRALMVTDGYLWRDPASLELVEAGQVSDVVPSQTERCAATGRPALRGDVGAQA
jgi:hypothetical protein